MACKGAEEMRGWNVKGGGVLCVAGQVKCTRAGKVVDSEGEWDHSAGISALCSPALWTLSCTVPGRTTVALMLLGVNKDLRCPCPTPTTTRDIGWPKVKVEFKLCE